MVELTRIKRWGREPTRLAGSSVSACVTRTLTFAIADQHRREGPFQLQRRPGAEPQGDLLIRGP
jgi:hypothetical protein